MKAARRLGAVVLTAMVVLATAPARAATLTDLGTVEAARDVFNRDAGKQRLVLFVSPT